MDENTNRTSSISQTILIILTLIFLATSVFLLVRNLQLQGQLDGGVLSTSNIDLETLAFMDDFIKIVLKSDTEVSFEDRLKLENSVRELGNDNILASWQSFVNSNDEVEAQANVVALLEVLVVELGGERR
jgi:hypothetical protein